MRVDDFLGDEPKKQTKKFEDEDEEETEEELKKQEEEKKKKEEERKQATANKKAKKVNYDELAKKNKIGGAGLKSEDYSEKLKGLTKEQKMQK